MSTYGDGRIARLAQSLKRARLAPEVADHIMAGGEELPKGATNEQVATWMKGAMARMDASLDRGARHAVRQGCACCLGGKRREQARAVAANYATLEERIRAIDETRMCYFQNVRMLEDGRIRLGYFPDGWDHYTCPCLRGTDEILSITYCYCCGGHVQHHMETALGLHLEVEVVSSSLSSGGKLPCVFALTIVE